MNIGSKLPAALFAILSALFFAPGVFAQATEPGKFYVGIGVGPIIPQNVTANLNGTIAGNGTLKFNASGFVGLVIGYRITDHFGLE